MVTMATGRTAVERRAIAEFLTGKTFATALSTTPAPRAMCTPRNAPFTPGNGPSWSGWGQNTSNTRYQSAAGLTAADVPKLKLKWAFAFPGDLQSYSHTTISGGRIFVGSWGGKVYSLNAATGCIHWFFDAGAGVRSAISLGEIQTASGQRWAAFFGDQGGNAYALDATTGAQIWKTHVDDFPVARVSGSPTLYNGKLYVPVASGEEASGAVPTYECCKFRGSIVALDAATGQAGVEDLHHHRDAAADQEEQRRRAVVWSVRGAGVGDAGHRSGQAGALHHDRQQLQRPRLGDERRLRGHGPRDRPDPLAQADDRQRRLHGGVPAAEQDQLRRLERPRLGLRRVTDAGDDGGRPPAAPGRTEIGHRPRPGSGQGRQRGVADARRPRRHHGRRAVGHGHGRHQHLRRQLRHRTDHADLQQRHRRRSETGRRHVRAAAHRRRARVVSTAGQLRHAGRAAARHNRRR